MAGGTWVSQNKVRPGVYINFASMPKPFGQLGERGVVAYPAALPWGSPRLIELEAETYMDKSLELIGFHPSDERIRHVTAAIAHANKILLYRLGGTGAEKATAKEGALTATAKWGGERGNDLKIVVQANIDDPAAFDVITLLDNEKVDLQTVTALEELMANAFIDWSGTGAPSVTAGVLLAGGTSGTAVGSDLSDALSAFESQELNVIGLPLDDQPSKQLVASYVRRLREEEGNKIVAVMADYPQADYEGVISLKNGIVTSDGLQVAPTMVLWEIAAMVASAGVNESLTYSAIPNAVDAYPRLTNSETIQALRNGEVVLTAVNGTVVIEQDINTLTSYTSDRGKAFSKNRVVRVLDTMANDIKRIFNEFYIGKVSNNSDGRNLLKAKVISYLLTLQGIGAIQNFDSQSDVAVEQAVDADSVLINLSIQPVDAIEKIYMTVEVA